MPKAWKEELRFVWEIVVFSITCADLGTVENHAHDQDKIHAQK